MNFGDPQVPCERCGKQQVHYLNGKTSDLCQVIYPSGKEHLGYVPDSLPGGVKSEFGDYVSFAWCGACGQIQQGLED